MRKSFCDTCCGGPRNRNLGYFTTSTILQIKPQITKLPTIRKIFINLQVTTFFRSKFYQRLDYKEGENCGRCTLHYPVAHALAPRNFPAIVILARGLKFVEMTIYYSQELHEKFCIMFRLSLSLLPVNHVQGRQAEGIKISNV